ncbi:MAG: hypothetical protein GEU28_13365 [Dehalococcoidia bacterium]|nr:hypothetical protein [Dehalococcoidia bacterium]
MLKYLLPAFSVDEEPLPGQHGISELAEALLQAALAPCRLADHERAAAETAGEGPTVRLQRVAPYAGRARLLFEGFREAAVNLTSERNGFLVRQHSGALMVPRPHPLQVGCDGRLAGLGFTKIVRPQRHLYGLSLPGDGHRNDLLADWNAKRQTRRVWLHVGWDALDKVGDRGLSTPHRTNYAKQHVSHHCYPVWWGATTWFLSTI